MKIINNKLYEKYTKTVIDYHTDYSELTKEQLHDIFRFHCQGQRLLNEVVDYIYKLIQEDNMRKTESKKCKYCAKYNGDHFDDESERYDYYSCELMNEQDRKKYGMYGSKDNEVFEECCLYPFCDTCQFKDELEGNNE